MLALKFSSPMPSRWERWRPWVHTMIFTTIFTSKVSQPFHFVGFWKQAKIDLKTDQISINVPTWITITDSWYSYALPIREHRLWPDSQSSPYSVSWLSKNRFPSTRWPKEDPVWPSSPIRKVWPKCRCHTFGRFPSLWCCCCSEQDLRSALPL